MHKSLTWLTAFGIAALFPILASAQEEETVKQTADEPSAQTAQEEDDSDEERPRRRYAEGKASINGEDVLVQHSFSIAVGTADYVRVPATESGEVVEFTLSAPPKLLTDVDLVIGDMTVKAHNVHPAYPGVYSLWLKKADDGWKLVANEKADVWGTMHDPAADVGETPVAYEQVGDDSEVTLAIDADSEERPKPMKVTFEETDDGHLLKIVWGAHQWTAPVTAAN